MSHQSRIYFALLFLNFQCKGEIKIGQKLAEVKDKVSWEAAVTEKRVGLPDRDVLPSECCQICQGMYPDTKAWSKNVHQTKCKCLSFSDDFDISAYEVENKNYTIGFCNSKRKYSYHSKCTLNKCTVHIQNASTAHIHPFKKYKSVEGFADDGVHI